MSRPPTQWDNHTPDLPDSYHGHMDLIATKTRSFTEVDQKQYGEKINDGYHPVWLLDQIIISTCLNTLEVRNIT